VAAASIFCPNTTGQCLCFRRLSNIEKDERTRPDLTLYHHRVYSCYPLLVATPTRFFTRSYYPARHMATRSESSVFESLFQSGLEEYEKQTGIDLLKHPLAAQLECCESVESISRALQEQAQAFCEFRRDNDQATTLLKNALHILHKLSSTAVLGEASGLVCRNCS
jgi:hypothetical protein